MDPSNTTSSSSNKIRQIVRLQQLLKKWKKAAAASPSSAHLRNNTISNRKTTNKSLKKTLSLSDMTDITNSSGSSSSTTTSSSTRSINKLLKKTLSFSEKDMSDRDTPTSSISNSKSINKFLKKTLSFTERDSADGDIGGTVPKGRLAVCVGRDEEVMKRFVIPMDYLAHQSFQILLREAEEEFGFQQQGVLKIPCEVSVFEDILKMMHNKRQPPRNHNVADNATTIHNVVVGFCSPDNHQHRPPQLCN